MNTKSDVMGAAHAAATAAAVDRCEVEMQRGQILVIQGMIVTVASILIYCAVSFQSGSDAELTAIMFNGGSPMLLATLVGMGLGTLLWLFGCVMYLRAAMDADPSKVPE